MSNAAIQLPFFQNAGSSLADKQEKPLAIPVREAEPGKQISQASVLAEVQNAVQSILGTAVGNDTPLIQAGLDSLGRAPPEAR